MFNSQVVKDRSGQHYIIRLRNQGQLNLALQPEKFYNTQVSYQFVHSLQAPFGLWQNIASSNSFFSLQRWQNTNPSLSIEHYAAEVLVQGFVEVYKTTDIQQLQQQARKTQVKDSVGRGYQLQPAASLLLEMGREIKVVQSDSEAQNFVNELNLSEDNISALNKSFNLTSAGDATATLISGLVKGDVTIALIPPARKPKVTTEYIEETVKPSEPAPTTPKKSSAIKTSPRDDQASADVLKKAAEEGAPFCEECQKNSEQKPAVTPTKTAVTVERDDTSTAEVLEKAAEAGMPFCEECQKNDEAKAA